MDTLTRYNQKILAILGTLTLVALSVTLLISLAIWIISIADHFGDVDNTLHVTDSLVQEDGKIRQLVSFDQAELIDTTNNIFIIPVTQRTLESPIDQENLRLKMGSYSSDFEYGYSGSYNNMIVYWKNTGQKIPLFNFRINITRYYTTKVLDKYFLLMIGSKGDTNLDGKFSNDDLANLYLYDLLNGRLNTISLEKAGFEHANILHESDEMILSFGFDINNDGEYDPSREPIRLKYYSVARDEMTEFIPESMQKQMQDIVD